MSHDTKNKINTADVYKKATLIDDWKHENKDIGYFDKYLNSEYIRAHDRDGCFRIKFSSSKSKETTTFKLIKKLFE